MPTAPDAEREWTVNDMYESPIELLVTHTYDRVVEQQEEGIYKAVLHFVPNVNEGELLRALQYDRDQYQKGYADGKADAEAALVRCEECRFGQNPLPDHGVRQCAKSLQFHPNDWYCPNGMRKDGD